MKKKLSGFTLVELIVVIIILTILGTIAFLSFQGYSSDARDSTRTTDLSSIKTSLELFNTKVGGYPLPTSYTGVTYSGGLVWNQGTFGIDPFKQVGNISKVPLDPLTSNEYTYSITNTKGEYEIAVVYEGLLAKNKNILNQANAGSVQGNVKIMGSYNGVYVMTNTGGTNFTIFVPTIINGDMSVLDLPSMISGGKIVVMGGTKLPDSYKNSNFKNEDFSTQIGSNIIISTGSLADLKAKNGTVLRQEFLDNLKTILSGTTVENNYKELINTTSDTLALNLVSGKWKANIYNGAVAVNTPTEQSGPSDIIDFETDGEGTLYTTTQGTFTRTTVEKNEGLYSIESGNQTDSSSSCFEVTKTISLNFDVIFDYKVSSESGYDYLNYYVNSVLDNGWAGEVIRTTYTKTYSPGTYTFKWCYEKDGSVSEGQDKSWVDNIRFVQNLNGCASTPTTGTIPNLGTVTVGSPNSQNQTWSYSDTPGNCTYTCASGYSGENCATVNGCASTPTNGTIPNLGTTTVGNPNIPNQAWTYSSTPGNCTYTCASGYSGENCDIAINSWGYVDPNCNEPDITIGSQVWAGCNSTIGSGYEWGQNPGYAFGVSCNPNYDLNSTYNISQCGASVTGMSSNSIANTWFSGTSLYGDHEVSNIWGKFYKLSGRNSACQNGRHVPSEDEWKTLETALNGINCQPYSQPNFGCDNLGWKNYESANISNNIVKALKIPLSGYLDTSHNYSGRGLITSLWTSSSYGPYAFGIGFFMNGTGLNHSVYDNNYNSLVVRCIKD